MVLITVQVFLKSLDSSLSLCTLAVYGHHTGFTLCHPESPLFLIRKLNPFREN